MKESAPKLSQFHPIIVLIEIFMVGSILLGIELLILGHGLQRVLGGASIQIGTVIALYGYRSLSTSNPRKAGLLTFLGIRLSIFGHPVVVGGKFFIIPWLMGIIEIDIDNKTTIIDVDVVSSNNVPIIGKVLLNWRAEISDAPDFVQAGNDKQAMDGQLNGPVVTETRDVARRLTDLEICQQGDRMSAMIERRIRNNLFQQKGLGIRLIFVRTDFPMPEAVAERMLGVRQEDYDRVAELKDSSNMTAVARAMQQEDAIQFMPEFNGKKLSDLGPDELVKVDGEICKPGGLLHQGKVQHFDYYRKQATERRLIKDGKVTVNKIEGVRGSFYLAGNGRN